MKHCYSFQYFFQAILVCMAGLLISSCTQHKEQPAIAKETTKIVPPQVTILANLPDSSKPQVTLLAERPKPEIKINVKPGKIHSFIDSLTGLPLAPEVQGIGFFTSYTTDNGLSSDMIACSTLDKNGAIWFGSYGGGVTRYDGKKFTTYTMAHGLANNTVRCMLEDSKGNLWFGTPGAGVSKYDGKRFTSYATAQGLGSIDVLCIFEDRQGNLWFSTNGRGVSKFDGKQFTSYTTAHGLAHNKIWNILEDRNGNLWFSTDGAGISKYDGKQFTTYTTAQGLASNDVFSILEDRLGNLWFGTMGGGLSKYDGQTFTTYTTSQGLASNSIISCLEDRHGHLWFGTLGGGMSKYDGQRFTTYTTNQGLASNGVTSIIEDKLGNIWLGTLGGGVNKFGGKSFTSFTTAHGLGNNTVSVMGITEDKTGNMWIATVFSGVSTYDDSSFATYSKEQGLATNNLLACMADKAGNLWFGTDGGGVSKFDGNRITTYTTAHGLGSNDVMSMLEDSKGNLWFGTIQGGVSKFDGQRFTTYTTLQGLALNRVGRIYEDRLGNLWFGTDGGGVSKFDGNRITTYTTDQGLKSNDVTNILEDRLGNLLFTTGQGLSVISSENLIKTTGNNTTNEAFNELLFQTFTTKDGLLDNDGYNISEDDEGRLIIGSTSGIAVLKKGIRSFGVEEDIEVYGGVNGYPVKDVRALFSDSKGVIWIGTGSDKIGLVRFDYKAVYKTQHASMLVLQEVKINNETIGWNTLLSSNVEKQGKVLDSLATPASINEEVSAFGRRLLASEKESMQRKFSDIQFDSIAPWYPVPQRLVLPYQHNSIAFEFNAIETSRNFMVKYQYKLEGYDEDWSSLTTHTSATFGNMYEGNYTFKVKALSPEGVWSKPVTYSFTVLPPWWRSPWAYGLYGLVVLGVAVMGRQAIIRSERQKAHQRLRLLQAEQLHQIDQLKSRFFTNISHEFRTPLTLIFAPLEKLLTEQLDTVQVKKNLRLIDRHARQLLHLINQLMDFSKLESGSLKLTLIHGDINQQIKVLTFSFFSLAESTGINLAFSSAYQSIDAQFDSNVLEKVMHNLLSNALKFTPPGGSVKVTVTLSKNLEEDIKNTSPHSGQWLGIHVKDTGVGIPADEQDRIFDRFYQVDASQIREAEGTGIGLALVKELVELHGGRIKVTSEVGQGSEFNVYLPLAGCTAQLNPSANGQEMMQDGLMMVKQEDRVENRPLSDKQNSAEESEANEGFPLLLVVEDNKEVREFIRDNFIAHFRVIEALNGLEGLEISRKQIPDLIITDRMMPKMDGMELCRQLKTNALTSHIPVIMLTAKTAQESKIEGLEIGADDYVAKPFSLQELKARVKNLIEQRKKLRERFTKEIKLQPKDIAVTSADEQFINKAIAIIEKHMSDEGFTVEIMVEEIAMSRVQLHRKLKALTDQSTSEFIRTIRLKRAASLLEQGYGSVSEVMYAVGFNSVSYFASNFKQRYGVNPSQFPPSQSTNQSL